MCCRSGTRGKFYDKVYQVDTEGKLSGDSKRKALCEPTAREDQSRFGVFEVLLHGYESLEFLVNLPEPYVLATKFAKELFPVQIESTWAAWEKEAVE